MARVGVGHAGPEANAVRAQRAERQAGVDLAEEALIGEPEIVVARVLGQRGQVGQPGRLVCRQDEESSAERHEAVPSAHGNSGPTRSGIHQAQRDLLRGDGQGRDA